MSVYEHIYPGNHSIVMQVNKTDVKTDRLDYFAKLTAMLDTIQEYPLGRELLSDIDNTGHKVKIKPCLAQSNQTAADNKDCYVKLRAAFDFTGVDLATEMKVCLTRAQKGGRSLEGLAKQIIGMNPVTRKTAQNVSKAPAQGFQTYQMKREGIFNRTMVPKKDPNTMAALTKSADLTVESLAELLDGLTKGTVTKTQLVNYFRGEQANRRHLQEDIIRALYVPYPSQPICTPGNGCSATVHIDVDSERSCWFDKEVTRPPVVGLVHELIHAWRNTRGLRYFGDMPKTPGTGKADDEVMTTGFPPYHNEKFSENVFRGLMKIKVDGMEAGSPRDNY